MIINQTTYLSFNPPALELIAIPFIALAAYIILRVMTEYTPDGGGKI